MALSSRWLEALAQQFADGQVGSPYGPSLDPAGPQATDSFAIDAADPSDPMGIPSTSAIQPSASSGLATDPGSSSFLQQLRTGVAAGGVGGGLSALFADPMASREGGANNWDMFRGITKSVGRAIGSAYGNPGFALAAQKVEDEGSLKRAHMDAYQHQTSAVLQAQAEKRARHASVTRAMQGIDPTTRKGNAEAVNILSSMGEYEMAKNVSGLYRADAQEKAPAMRTIMKGGSEEQQELQADGTWKTVGSGPRWNPSSAGTNVTVSPNIIMPGHDEPTKGEKTDLQGKTITTNDMLSRLRETERLYDPSYQQLGTKVGMWSSRWTEKLGGSLSAEDADQFEKYSTFRATAYDNLSQTLKEMSGAAVTPQEYERLKQSLPDPGTGITGSGDSPTEFESKLKRATRGSKLALIRYGYAQNLGIPIDGIPLDLGTLKQRIGDKTEKEALAAGRSQQEAEAIAVDTIKRTFGGL